MDEIHNYYRSDITLTACGQFMICPSGEENGCVGRPHIVSNSWGGQPPGDNGWYDPVISAMRAANIIPVFGIINLPSLKIWTSKKNQVLTKFVTI